MSQQYEQGNASFAQAQVATSHRLGSESGGNESLADGHDTPRSPSQAASRFGVGVKVHPTAVVDPEVELGEGVTVGAYAVIEGPVSIGAGSRILPHCVLGGPTRIGTNCQIGPAAYVGLPAQHLAARPKDAWLVIGDNTVIREGSAIHRSMRDGIEHATRIGRDCFIMGQTHIAHDCQLGNNVIMANGSLIAGHVHIGDRAFLGGGSVVHQFVNIGRLAIIRGNEAISHDIPPFAAAAYGGLKGYNAIGCRRSGMKQQSLSAIRAAYHCIHSHRTAIAALTALRKLASNHPEVQELVEFLGKSKRGVAISVRFMHSSAAEMEAAGDL